MVKHASVYGKYRRGDLTYAQYLKKRGPWPETPSDYDYQVAREEGAIQ